VHSIDIDEAKELRTYLQKIKVSNRVNILNSYEKFYKTYAKNYLTTRLEKYSKIMGLSYSEIRFRKMRSRWGSCSSKGTITLNTELIKINKELIDYIIVHELAHLTHMNHSQKFHDLVDVYISNSKELKKKLKTVNLLQ